MGVSFWCCFSFFAGNFFWPCWFLLFSKNCWEVSKSFVIRKILFNEKPSWIHSHIIRLESSICDPFQGINISSSKKRNVKLWSFACGRWVFSEPSLSLYVSIGYPWSHCLQNHIQKKIMLMKSQHLKPYRCLVLLYRFRPTFDLPIPPIYQPSTIETVARDRSPRHSGEKWKFWPWKPPKKWWNHFQLCWNIYIYIYQSLSTLEEYIGGFFKNLQIPENKIFGRSVFLGGRFTES